MDDFDKQFSNRYPSGQDNQPGEPQVPQTPEPPIDISSPLEREAMPPRPENDLLAQISANDAEEEAKRSKSSHSYMMEIVVLFMKLTFILDDAKRKYHKIFDVLAFIWAGFMSIIYAGGLAMLVLLVYAYIQFPAVLQENLERQGIKVKDFKVDNYTFSLIELDDLVGADDMFTIKKMSIHSTFSDFIKRRVKSVTLDGVRIKIKATKSGFELGTLPKTLVTLNHSPLTKTVKVDNLMIQNAVLEINGQDFTLPVSFSLTGIYEKDSKISMPIYIKEENINVAGALDIHGNAKEMTFTFEIKAGTLTLPRRSPENISGKIDVLTKNMKVARIQGEAMMSYGNNAKKMQVNLDCTNDNLFRGTLDLSYVSADPYGKDNDARVTASLNFDGVSITKDNQIISDKPIKIVVQNFQNQDLSLSNLSATLNGRLECKEMACSYKIDRSSPVFVRESSLLFNGDTIRSSGEYSFLLGPNNRQTINWRDNRITFNALAERMSFSGYRNSQVSPVSLTIPWGTYKGEIDLAKGTKVMSADMRDTSVKTPEFSASKVTFKSADIFDERARIEINAGHVLMTESEIFKQPFKLVLDQTGLDTKALISLSNNAIRLSFSGVARLLSGEFRGNVFLHEVDLSQIYTPLNQISSLFPDFMQNAKGKIGALGTVYWKNSKQITGPLYVSLKDVGFGTNGWSVEGLNTVLTLQSLEPLITPANQKIFISNFKGPIILQNILLDGKADSQFFKLNKATAMLLDISLQADSALIPRKTTNATVFFKNNSVNWAMANRKLNLGGMYLSGRGSVLLPIEFRDSRANIKNAEIKMSNGEIDLSKMRDKKLKSYFGDASRYVVRTGTLLMNSSDTNENMTTLNISLDGRLVPGVQIKTVRENLDENLSKYIRILAPQAVPEDIVKKQQIIAK